MTLLHLPLFGARPRLTSRPTRPSQAGPADPSLDRQRQLEELRDAIAWEAGPFFGGLR